MKSPFRSIRQKLFTEGKLVRYLGYAVGEIALIIIGIMVALELNNWNEDLKAQAEFDLYIVQLKEDVQQAIANAVRSQTFMERNLERSEFVLQFLELSEYGPEELATFEAGLNALGSYNEPQVYVGLLGQLLNGGTDIIGRNKAVAKMALEMESRVERYLNNLDHVYNQIDLDGNSINLIRGKGGGSVPPKYRLETLKTSDKFIYAAYSVSNRTRTVINFTEFITKALEDFLAVLEEY